MKIRSIPCILFAATLAGGASAPEARLALKHALPPLNGSHESVSLVEVTYPPGGASEAHSHPCPVLVYVLEGAVRTQVKGELEKTFETGESFYEAPDGVHEISANASTDRSARFVAFFVCDHDAPLSTKVAGQKP